MELASPGITPEKNSLSLGCCLAKPLSELLQVTLLQVRLARSPKVNFWELLWQNVHWLDAFPVTQSTAPKHGNYQT